MKLGLLLRESCYCALNMKEASIHNFTFFYHNFIFIVGYNNLLRLRAQWPLNVSAS